MIHAYFCVKLKVVHTRAESNLCKTENAPENPGRYAWFVLCVFPRRELFLDYSDLVIQRL